MLTDGIISHYALGGAVAATFYLEPAATLDVAVFVLLPNADGTLVSLSPIYEYLKSPGGIESREYITIGDWPVQFLVPANELEREAVATAVPVDVEGVRTWVMLAEHLVAIALSVGRAKDYIRILQFINEKAVDRKILLTVLETHGLTMKWKQFEHRFLAGGS